MKTFIFSATYKNALFNRIITLKIYRVKNNKPSYLGEIKFNSGLNKGNSCEAVFWLVDNKHLPKKCIDKCGYINFDEANKTFNVYEI